MHLDINEILSFFPLKDSSSPLEMIETHRDVIEDNLEFLYSSLNEAENMFRAEESKLNNLVGMCLILVLAHSFKDSYEEILAIVHKCTEDNDQDVKIFKELFHNLTYNYRKLN